MSSTLIGPHRDVLRGEALELLYRPQPAPVIEDSKSRLYRFAGERIGQDAPILYLEFGVAHGDSMRAISALFTDQACRFVGFDSFVGLPEPWLMHDRGAFDNGGKAPAIDDPRVSFVTGWFQNTVPGFLRSMDNLIANSGQRLDVLVHFDADLYSSTLFLLGTLWPAVREYWFLFDDFIQDDVVALRDFASAYPVEIEFLAQSRGGGDPPNPDHVFGRMRAVEFDPDREWPLRFTAPG
jgi:O-methyltransferase